MVQSPVMGGRLGSVAGDLREGEGDVSILRTRWVTHQDVVVGVRFYREVVYTAAALRPLSGTSSVHPC